MKIVAKIGSSSLTTAAGDIDHAAVAKLCAEVAELRREGHHVVVVTSAAISAGLGPLGYTPDNRPRDTGLLRAAAAVGQIALMATYKGHLASNGLTAGQVLLAPTDLWHRNRYLKSRGTLEALLARGVIPVINENDAVADDEIRFGDNDRLAALVAHLIDADCLVLLTDTAGVFTSDPRQDADASLIEEIVEIDQQLEAMPPVAPAHRLVGAGWPPSWRRPRSQPGPGSRPPSPSRIDPRCCGRPSRGWPGSAPSSGRGPSDCRPASCGSPSPCRRPVASWSTTGPARALEQDRRSLLSAGIIRAEGSFGPEDAVELVDESGAVFAKGLVRWSCQDIAGNSGRRIRDLPEDLADEVVHRDDLVILP